MDNEQRCWSCHHELRDGISLDSSGRDHICDGCWARIPVDRRLYLQLVFRRVEDGGLGLREIVEESANTPEIDWGRWLGGSEN